MTAHDDDTSLTVLQEIDAICMEFEQAWRSGAKPRIENYLARARAAVKNSLLESLLKLDHELWATNGEPPRLEEYQVRFPEFMEVIRAAFSPTMKHSDTHPQKSDFQHQYLAFPNVGDWVDEFELRAMLGEGGFGKVYRAWQHGVEREVALKVTRLGSHETRILSKLDRHPNHPNIVRIYDYREKPDRGFHIVYMEMVHGVTLRSIIARKWFSFAENGHASRSPESILKDESIDHPAAHSSLASLEAASDLTPSRSSETWDEQVCRIGSQLADALDHAHRRNIFHCDLKPSNILITADGIPKLVDFNVAYPDQFDVTDLPGIGGTKPYMSPEQLAAYSSSITAGQADNAPRLDGRSDLYSLAVVLWELLTGRRPFEGDSSEDVSPNEGTPVLTTTAIQSQQRLGTRAFSNPSANIPVGLSRVLQRCLAQDRDQRFATAAELGHELRLCSQPDLQDLLHPHESSWRAAILRWPAPLSYLILAGVYVNAVLAALNIGWNWTILSAPEVGASSQTFFWIFVAIINVPAFLTGAIMGIRLCLPVTAALYALQRDKSEEVMQFVIERCMKLGHYVAAVTLLMWTVASFVWGALMHKSLGFIDTLHFVCSVLISGMLAAGMVYFPITFVSVNAFLPRLLRDQRGRNLGKLDHNLDAYLGLLMSGSLLSIMLYVLLWNETGNLKYLLLVLVLVGAVGSASAYYWSKAIRMSLSLLSRLARQ